MGKYFGSIYALSTIKSVTWCINDECSRHSCYTETFKGLPWHRHVCTHGQAHRHLQEDKNTRQEWVLEAASNTPREAPTSSTECLALNLGSVFNSSFLLCHSWRQVLAQAHGFLPPLCGRPQLTSRLLTWAWSSSSCWEQLESESTAGRFLFQSLSALKKQWEVGVSAGV